MSYLAFKSSHYRLNFIKKLLTNHDYTYGWILDLTDKELLARLAYLSLPLETLTLRFNALLETRCCSSLQGICQDNNV